MTRSLALSFLALVALAVPALAETPAEPNALVVKIHADWCSTCKVLEPTWTELESDPRARFVILDVTDDATKSQARATAEDLGIASFFDAYQGKTGTIAILASDSGEVVAVHKGERDAGVYREVLATFADPATS